MTTATKNKEVVGKKPKETSAGIAGSASQEAKRGPVKQFRVDDVSASIFARQHNGRTFHSVSFTRSFKDAGGAFKYVKSFDVEDLGKVVTVTQQAAEWLHSLDYPEPEAL